MGAMRQASIDVSKQMLISCFTQLNWVTSVIKLEHLTDKKILGCENSHSIVNKQFGRLHRDYTFHGGHVLCSIESMFRVSILHGNWTPFSQCFFFRTTDWLRCTWIHMSEIWLNRWVSISVPLSRQVSERDQNSVPFFFAFSLSKYSARNIHLRNVNKTI